ncbi:uncharacterized protein LOC124933070 [Impatiens glandulifera]|uniref:uncharacterized protein LOC124933070 n=1 Tax=Impatiens glandulifera TaxID=253017 RepID=UPI001FB0D3C9|nr:uncharacterized protein LOC124933070 [Impatiens glandulifera]
MSRCLPFPPIGYSAKIAASDTLIDSIKLRETKDATAESKKERKREKKEKKERKLRLKQETNVFDQSRKRKHGEDKTLNLGSDSKLCNGNSGSKNDDFELLERSNITEEHGQPFCPQIPCTSDTSEDSNRRKRHCPNPPLETGIRAQGNILRIRLAPKKPENPIAVAPLKIKEELQHPISTIVRNQVELSQPKEPSSSGRTELTKLNKKLKRVDLVYTNLFENWVPSSLSSVEDDELGWLNGKRGSQNEEQHKQPKSDVQIGSSFNTTNLWQPRAIFLPEVEVYALPFTVPF